jgi:hypothetical protein
MPTLYVCRSRVEHFHPNFFEPKDVPSFPDYHDLRVTMNYHSLKYIALPLAFFTNNLRLFTPLSR